MATPNVGEDIEGICGRCGQTWHVVMAKVGDRVVKVVCKRCGTHHTHRGSGASEEPAGRRPPGGRSLSRRRKRPAPAPEPAPATFDPSKPPRPYSAQGSFAAGERVIHPTFGTGVVSGTPGPGKVAIVFPAGSRVMACAKAVSTLARPVAAAHVAIADRPPDK